MTHKRKLIQMIIKMTEVCEEVKNGGEEEQEFSDILYNDHLPYPTIVYNSRQLFD